MYSATLVDDFGLRFNLTSNRKSFQVHLLTQATLDTRIVLDKLAKIYIQGSIIIVNLLSEDKVGEIFQVQFPTPSLFSKA